MGRAERKRENVAGLMNKEREFWNFVEQFDFVGLTETWIEEKQWNRIERFLSGNYTWKYQVARRE